MKKIEILSNALTIFGLIFMAVFQLSKNWSGWPAFAAGNYAYIAFGSIGLGYLLAIIYYFLTKNTKKARGLLLFAVIMTVICFALYYFG